MFCWEAFIEFFSVAIKNWKKIEKLFVFYGLTIIALYINLYINNNGKAYSISFCDNSAMKHQR